MKAVGRSVQMIVSNADRSRILMLAQSLNLNIAPSWPYSSPKLRFFPTVEQALEEHVDVYLLLTDEWVEGEIDFDYTSSGDRAGTYAVKPRCNYFCIELYLPEERQEYGRTRAASAAIELRDFYFAPKTGSRKSAPDDVYEKFNLFCESIKSVSKATRIHGQRYLIGDICLRQIIAGELLPPFDYQDDYPFHRLTG